MTKTSEYVLPAILSFVGVGAAGLITVVALTVDARFSDQAGIQAAVTMTSLEQPPASARHSAGSATHRSSAGIDSGRSDGGTSS